MDDELEYRITEKGLGYLLGATEERNAWLAAIERLREREARWAEGLDALVAERDRA